MSSTSNERRNPRGPLFAQLRWFIRLRWLAAAGVIVGSLVDRRLGWYGAANQFLVVGLIIAAYNVALSIVLPRVSVKTKHVLTLLAEAQLLLDMLALTALSMWTGGLHSPLIGFFVFHMVFASLLLPETSAFGSAAAACAMIATGLAMSHNWPAEQADRLAGAGMLVTLVLTVMLTNRITNDLREQRKRLIRQNRRVRAMTRQLKRQQQALIQHEKMVAMGQMAAGVTHEITNPLASIDSLLQLSERRPEKFAKPETVQAMREQVARINQIIQQMKTFAHPADAEFQTLPINEVVEQAIGMVRFDRRIKQVQVKREFDPNAGVVMMLPQALQQVLVNLIINALDAMAAVESPVLTVKTHRREGWCLIDVSDNGHGIEERHVARLFEPFFTTKPVGQGTGLGLSISYSLMQKQGGSIGVHSQRGVGSSFVLRLPCGGHSRNREGAPKPIAVSENQSA